MPVHANKQPKAVVYDPAVPDLVNDTHLQSYYVTAQTATGQQIDLDVERCQIGWDEARAPRVQAMLTCRVPDQDTLNALDPRLGVRLRFYAGYRLPGGQVKEPLIANLGLRVRDVTRPENLMELDAQSDEAMVIDSRSWRYWLRTNPTVSSTVYTTLTEALPFDPVFYYDLPNNPQIPEVLLEKGGDYWSVIQDAVDGIDAEIFDEGRRQWVLRPRPVLAGTPSATLVVGEGGTILTSSTSVSRSGEWANAVQLRYTWTDASGVDHKIWGEAYASGVMAFANVGRRVFQDERRDIPTTQAKANAAARNILKRRLAYGRSFRLRAVSHLWLRPGMTVNVRLPSGPMEEHLISSVLFDLDQGWMDVTTRLPDLVNLPGE